MPKITKLVTGRSAIQTLQPTLWPENDRTRICLKQKRWRARKKRKEEAGKRKRGKIKTIEKYPRGGETI